MELYLHSPIRLRCVVLNKAQDTSSWCGASLNTRTSFLPYLVINLKKNEMDAQT